MEQFDIFIIDTYTYNQNNSTVNVIYDKLLEAGFIKIETSTFIYFLKN